MPIPPSLIPSAIHSFGESLPFQHVLTEAPLTTPRAYSTAELKKLLQTRRDTLPTKSSRKPDHLSHYLGLPDGVTKKQRQKALPEWRELAKEIPLRRAHSEHPGVSEEQSRVFQAKFALGPLAGDHGLALGARVLYDSLDIPSAQRNFLSILLYCRDPDELRFLLGALEEFHYKSGNFEGLLADLASEYWRGFEGDETPFGHFFELWAAATIQSKGAGLDVTELQTLVPLSEKKSQEVDLTVVAKDERGREARFHLELYSGRNPKDKDEQLDRYIAASLAQKAGVILLTQAEGGEDFIVTVENHVVPRLTASALLAMNGANLSRLLLDKYEEFWRQFAPAP